VTHGLRVLQPGGPAGFWVVQCLCGWIGSPREGAVWTVTPNGDGTANVRPSLDWAGHFHETFARAPLGSVDLTLRDRAFPSELAPTSAHAVRAEVLAHGQEGEVANKDPQDPPKSDPQDPPKSKTVRLYTDPRYTSLAGPAGSTRVRDGAFEVPADDAPAWLATEGVSAEPVK
jgi:hypothetical protein